MARHTKQGLDYFPVDCILDEKTEPFVIEYGAVGWAILTTVWSVIYRTKGYYAINEKHLWLMVKKQLIDVDINHINVCINSLISYEVFDKCLHDQYHILTSRGIQRRFFEASKRKLSVQYDSDFTLIDLNEYKNLINVNINSLNVDSNATNKIKLNKIKLKEIKLNKIKEKKDVAKKLFEEFWLAFPSRNGRKLGKPQAFDKFLALDEQNQVKIIISAKNYRVSQRVQENIGIVDPHRFIKSGKGYEPWKDWLEPEIPFSKPSIHDENKAVGQRVLDKLSQQKQPKIINLGGDDGCIES